MQSPYTASPHDAYLVAQSAAGAVLTGLAWFHRPRPVFALLLLTIAIWGCVLAPVEVGFLAGIGVHLEASHLLSVVAWSSTLATAAVLVVAPRWVGLLAIVVRIALAHADDYFTDSDPELAALHLMGIGFLLGLMRLAQKRPRMRADAGPPWGGFGKHDAVIFVSATALACLVSTYVLQRSCDSADEWSYTFQAAVFAKRQAYAAVPPCLPAFRNFWIFWKDGRMFSQYTPGWPLFCAPFLALGQMWLAAPVTHGLLAVGVARLARRAVAGQLGDNAVLTREIAVAGILGAVLVGTGSTMLINGASRFPHTFICALFAWSVEGICILTTRGIGTKRQWAFGVVTGLCAAFLLCTRPADGGLLGFGIFLYFVYALVKRRVRLRALIAVTVSFGLLCGLVLVILRLQLGEWFTTGYSLTDEFYPWNKMAFGAPGSGEYKWPFPLATGSYCWWPAAPAVGLAGMVALAKGGGRRICFMLSVGTLGLLAFYAMLAWGRGLDFGYGPRYQMPVIVPMSVGGAVALTPLVAAALSLPLERNAFYFGGPATLALAASVAGVVCIAPLVYPYNHEEVRLRNVVFRAIQKNDLHNAVVVVTKGSTISDQLDLTQNLPLDLYPDQDVLVISDQDGETHECVRELFPYRHFYRTSGKPEITLVPE